MQGEAPNSKLGGSMSRTPVERSILNCRPDAGNIFYWNEITSTTRFPYNCTLTVIPYHYILPLYLTVTPLPFHKERIFQFSRHIATEKMDSIHVSRGINISNLARNIVIF
jgi:hypothetical protein